jgi:hypothetical protein
MSNIEGRLIIVRKLVALYITLHGFRFIITEFGIATQVIIAIRLWLMLALSLRTGRHRSTVDRHRWSSFLRYSYGGLLSLVGLILLLIGVKGMSDYYKEGGIFSNWLYAVIVSIIGAVVFAAIIVWTIVTALTQLGISSWTDWAIRIQQNSGNFSAVWNLVSPSLQA